MEALPRAVGRGAPVSPSVLHSHRRDVHVTDDVTVHRYVLANHEPAPRTLINTGRLRPAKTANKLTSRFAAKETRPEST